MNYQDIPTSLRAKTVSLFSWVFMLPWHEVLQQASKGRWKCIGWNKFPWIIHPTFKTDSKKGCCKLRHVPSAPEGTPPWQWQQSKPLLYSSEQPNCCYCLFWQTLSLLALKDTSTPAPLTASGQAHGKSWTWKDLSHCWISGWEESEGISALVLPHHSWHHTTHYTSILNIPLGKKK